MPKNKPTKHKYSEGLIHAWMHGHVTELGAFYEGATTRLEATPDAIYLGYKAFPLAVRRPHPDKNIFIVHSLDGIGQLSAQYKVRTTLMQPEHPVRLRKFVPIGQRFPSARTWSNHVTHTEAEGLPNGYSVMVDRLTEQHATCDLATLSADAHAFVDRVVRKRTKGLSERKLTLYFDSYLNGFWSNWRSKEECDVHPDVVDPFRRTRRNFEAIGIPFKEEWEQARNAALAKIRLTK